MNESSVEKAVFVARSIHWAFFLSAHIVIICLVGLMAYSQPPKQSTSSLSYVTELILFFAFMNLLFGVIIWFIYYSYRKIILDREIIFCKNGIMIPSSADEIIRWIDVSKIDVRRPNITIIAFRIKDEILFDLKNRSRSKFGYLIRKSILGELHFVPELYRRISGPPISHFVQNYATHLTPPKGY